MRKAIKNKIYPNSGEVEYLKELLSAIERFSIANDIVSDPFISSNSLSSNKGTPIF